MCLPMGCRKRGKCCINRLSALAQSALVRHARLWCSYELMVVVVNQLYFTCYIGVSDSRQHKEEERKGTKKKERKKKKKQNLTA